MASGDDAFHADENLTVNAGTIHITKSYEGLEGLHVRIAGGEITLVASDDGLNAAGGTEVITVQVGSQAAGTALTLLDSEGNTVLTGTPDLPYETVILSSPQIQSKETYRITVDTFSAELTAS